MTGLLVMAAGAGVLAQEKGAADKAGHGAHSGAMMGLKKELIEGITEADFLKLGEAPKTVDITLVTTAGRDDLAMALLREFGWPFRGETPQALRVA